LNERDVISNSLWKTRWRLLPNWNVMKSLLQYYFANLVTSAPVLFAKITQTFVLYSKQMTIRTTTLSHFN